GTVGISKDVVTAQFNRLRWTGSEMQLATARHGGRLVLCVRTATAPTEVKTPPQLTHTVVRGETLASIARQKLGDAKRWKDILMANPGLNPAAIRVGQELILPVQAGAAVGPELTGLQIRLADSLGHVALDVTRVAFGPRGTNIINQGSWTLAESWIIPEPTQNTMVTCLVLAPSPARVPGASVAVLLGEPDSPPWWLLSGWTPLRNPP
ncbi:MAG: LysM domain-containing protein, partial [Planctomycetota bacterium]